MKTKFNFLFLLLALVSFTFVSCDDDETIVTETTLETSVQTVTFTKDGGPQSITVTTDASKWVATSPVEGQWLTLAVNGDQLSVTAAVNNESADRKSYILINAGSASAKVEVMQSAGDDALFIGAEAIEFLNIKGERRIDVVSNNGFTVEADADWMTVNYQPGADFFTVAVTPTDGTEARTGKIIVTSGNTIKEVPVTQEVVVLPFFGKSGESGLINMMEYEEARGCKVMTLPDGMFNNAYYYLSPDANFPQLGYAGNLVGDYLQGLTATLNLNLKDAIKEALTRKGFTEADGIYTHAEYPYAVTVEVAEDGITITSNYNPVQDKDYPTWETVPMKDPQMKWTPCRDINLHGSNYKEVAVPWEAANGGTFNEAMGTYPATGDFAWYDMSKELQQTGLYARSYWIYHDKGEPESVVDPSDPFYGEISSARAIYTSVDKAFWTPDGGNSFYMTREFGELLTKNGFQYLQSNQGYEFYVLPNEKGGYWDVIAFGVAKFSDVLEGKPIVDFQVFKWEIQATSVASVLTDKDLLVETITGMTKVLLRNEKSQTIHRIK